MAESVAVRLVATGALLEDDPQGALAQALVARRPASRIGVVREAVGIAAYRAGEWKLAISELRAYQRISGRSSHLAVIADCERALGRPERAIDLYREADTRQFDQAELTELLIVAAGARRDLGQEAAALAMLQVPALRSGRAESWVARLRYAYADQLLLLGREDEAREWFQRAVDADPDGESGAAERLLELEGVVLEEAEPEAEEPAEIAEDASAEPPAAEQVPVESVAEPSPAEPSPAEPSPAEPSPAEPSPAEPSPAEPSPAEPPAVEEALAEPPGDVDDEADRRRAPGSEVGPEGP
ncbi:MAG: Replicase polyprotein 1ab [Micromonosporaceae bacterium]